MMAEAPEEARELLAQLKRRNASNRGRALDAFDPVALGWLALPPLWTAEAALHAEFPIESLSPDGPPALGTFLDSLLEANLIETIPDFVRSSWNIAVRPATDVTGTSAGLTSRITQRFVAAGLLLPPEAEAAATPNTEHDFLSEEFSIGTRDALLRCDGLRFPVNEPWPVDQAVDVAFTLQGESEPTAVFRGRTLGGGGSEWQGRVAVIGYTKQLHGPPHFLLHHLYREFRLAEKRRDEVLERVRSAVLEQTRSPRSLQNLCLEIAERLEEVRQQESALPEILERWCKLVRWFSEGTIEGDRHFTRELRTHLDASRTGEAAAWVSVAETVARVFGGEVETVVRLGRRRLELAARRDVDLRHLHSFFRRDEQLLPLRELLEPEPSFWALHYLGGGGVGKTMLLRYVVTEVLPQFPGGELPFARIDFDDLNADYPLRRPAQLLMELGGGLRAFGDEGLESRTEMKFHEFRQQAEACHAELEEELREVADPRPVLESPIFQSVVNYFCDFLSLFRSPAVFILDTCEELARVHGEAGLRPAVEATFKIFEMVQARIKLMNDPQLKPPRIIFAGRRLLAVAGDRWEAAGDSGPARAGILGERRDYLRVEVLRGFTRREAHTFLTEPEYKGPPSDAKHSAMNPTLEEAVLSHSPESLSSDKIIAPTMVSPPSAATSQEQPRPEASVRVSRFHGGGEADTDAKRYNPFDLSLYADWYNDQPTLTDAELRRGGSDPYIRNRIIGRLKRGDVLAALPFLVELRRVGCAMAPDGTRPLLQRALQITDTEFDLLRRELCQLEWLDYQTENRGTIERIFLSVDRNLLSRFQRFLAGPEWRARREQARDVLRPLLHEHMEAPLLEDLETSYLTAALRLLPRTEAAWLWAAIESKVAAEAAWGWASNICRDIVAAAEAHTEYELLRREGGEEVVPLLTTDPDGDVVGHVRATLASASIHTSAKADLRLLWERVRLEAQEYEVPELGTWLWQRAVLGRLASQTQQNEVPTSAALDNLRELLASQTLDLRSWSPGTSPSDPTVMERALQIRASAIATISSLLELVERTGRAEVLPVEELSAWLAASKQVAHNPPEFSQTLDSLSAQLAFLQRQTGRVPAATPPNSKPVPA